MRDEFGRGLTESNAYKRYHRDIKIYSILRDDFLTTYAGIDGRDRTGLE